MSEEHIECKWKAQLDVQLNIEEYRNDLIDTLRELLVAKETLIAELRERIIK